MVPSAILNEISAKAEIQYARVPPMRLFRPIEVRTAFGIALLVLTVAAFLSFWNLSRLEEAANQVSHTHEVLDRLDDLLFAFRDSIDRKSTRLNSSHGYISYAVFCLKKKKKKKNSDLRKVTSIMIAQHETM